MKRMLVASVFVTVPLAANAADLSEGAVDYNFIQDNAPSQPAVVGHLSLGLGYVKEEYSNGAPDFDYGMFGGAGRANIEFGWLNLELETGGSSAFNDGNSYSAYGVLGHLWGEGSNIALGVYGGASFPSGYTYYTLGGEAEAYLGALTLGADFDYNWTDGAPFGDFWTTRGWADVYVTSNTRLGAEFAYGSWEDLFGSGDFTFWSVTVDAEHRFAGTPVSLWLEGSYSHADLPPSCPGCEIDQWSGMAGFRVFLDADGTTLHEHDKMVPWEGSLPDIRYLPFGG